MSILRCKGLKSYEVFGEIRNGEIVMCLDRAKHELLCLNKIAVEKVVEIVVMADASEKDYGYYPNVPLYDFWIEYIEETEQEDTDADTV